MHLILSLFNHIWVAVCCGIFIVVFLIQLYYYLRYYRVVLRRKRLERKGKINFSVERPGVSVIICAHNEAENLQHFLPLFLEQNYRNYEVIVVNDGSWDDSEEILKHYAELYPHLYYTNIPKSTRIISHKKLAITMGVKAAKNDILLFSDADCRPLSPFWIEQMVRNFTNNTEFVIGYGGYYANKSLLSRMICYDTQTIAMQYLAFASAGSPYMAVGRNMAYRKETFYRLKGFAGFLHLPSGDDDLLINAAGNRENTRIETNIDSITMSLPKLSFRDWIKQKRRHLSTSSVYTEKSKMKLMGEPLSRALFYGGFVVMLTQGELYLTLFACLLFLIRWIIQISVYNCTASYWKERKTGILLIIWDLFLPLINLYLLSLDKIFYRGRRDKW